MSRAAALAAVAAVAVAAVASRAHAAQRWAQDETPAEPGARDLPGYEAALGEIGTSLYENAELMREAIQGHTEADTRAANRAAFLATIAHAEGTGAEYAALYGHRPNRPRLARSLAEHPYLSGEWEGERLPDALCAGAGFGPGCITTAAGRYQFLARTWSRLRDRLSLADFGPESQDAAALQLARECGALVDIDAGRIADALEKCRRVWASLPGAGYAQPERSLGALVAVFQQQGGTLDA